MTPLPGRAERNFGVQGPPVKSVMVLAGVSGMVRDAFGDRILRQAKQAVQVWKNIEQVLKADGMGYKDIVKITTFLTDSRFVVPNRAARDQFISAPYPASTLLVVAGLADPAMLVEIEVLAAKA